MDSVIKELKNIILAKLDSINDQVFKRNSKIKITDLFFYIANLINSPRNSSVTVTSELLIEDLVTANDSAFRKKRQLIDFKYFNEIADLITNFYYTNMDVTKLLDKYRIFSADGTYIQVPKELEKDGYKLTKNGTYVNALVGGLYDINNQLIIDLNMSNKKNERDIFFNQCSYLSAGDVVVFDRNYYSERLLYDLNKMNIYPIFRMKKNNIYYKDLLETNNNEKIYEICTKKTNNIPIKIRLIKYVINKKIYVLLTTILDENVTVNVLKEIYKKRWNIEEYFKSIKYCLSFNDFHSKSEKLIKQEIAMHKFVTNLTRTFEEIYKKNNKDNIKKSKNNFKNNILHTTKYILKNLLYGKKYIKNIIHILTILFKYITKIRKKRKSYPRRRIKPPSIWYDKRNEVT